MPVFGRYGQPNGTWNRSSRQKGRFRFRCPSGWLHRKTRNPACRTSTTWTRGGHDRQSAALRIAPAEEDRRWWRQRRRRGSLAGDQVLVAHRIMALRLARASCAGGRPGSVRAAAADLAQRRRPRPERSSSPPACRSANTRFCCRLPPGRPAGHNRRRRPPARACSRQMTPAATVTAPLATVSSPGTPTETRAARPDPSRDSRRRPAAPSRSRSSSSVRPIRAALLTLPT